MKRRAVGVAGVVGLLLWIGLPLVLVGRVREVADDQQLRTVRPTAVPVRAASARSEQPVGLHLAWSPVPAAVAPAWTGLIDAVSVRPGQEVHDGDVVLSIDRGQRTLVASSKPFTRPLAYPALGADVADLNAFLARHGFEASPADRFGGETERGVKAFATAHGLPANGFFLPEWVVFLPAPSATIAAVDAVVAAPAPIAGTELLTFRSSLGSVRLIPVQDDSDEAAPPSGGTDPGATSGGGTGGGPGATAAATAAQQAAMAKQPTVTAPGGATIDLDGTTLHLGRDRRSLSPASVATLRRDDDDTTPYLRAAVVTTQQRGRFMVPSAAVIADPATRGLCVIETVDRRRRPVPVIVVDDVEGRATVTGHLTVGRSVAVGIAHRERSCR